MNVADFVSTFCLFIKERETKMKEEIDKLREELHCQSKKMAENNNLVLHLQEQLVKLQSEQLRQTARGVSGLFM